MKKQFILLTYIAALLGLLLLSSAAFAQGGSANVPLLVNVNQHAASGYNDCWGYTAGGGNMPCSGCTTAPA